MSAFYGLFCKRLRIAAVLTACALPVEAATTTSNFNVQMIITATCTITSASNLDFGTVGLLNANTDATSTIQVQCTNTTPYDIGLDDGSTAGGSIAVRKMTSGAATIDYSMYSNAGRTTNWGETVGSDTVSATGNGSVQSYTVYGRVPTQTSVAPGTYTDSVTVTVTY